VSAITTVGGLIYGAHDALLGGRRQQITRLDGSIVAAGASLIVSNIDAVSVGSFLNIDDELVYVEAKNPSSRTCEIIRAMRGTTAADHDDGALVYVDPIFARHTIRREIRNEVGSWPADLFYPTSTTFERIATGSDVWKMTTASLPSLADRLIGILDVTVSADSATESPLRVDQWALTHYSTNINGSALDEADLRIQTNYGGTSDLIVVVAATPVATASLWDDDDTTLSALSIPENWADIVLMGAAWRLMLTRDVGRSLIDAQPEPRRAEEVPIGASGSIATMFKRSRDARINEEIIKLKARWPLRRH
jgi:hypothetical protein